MDEWDERPTMERLYDALAEVFGVYRPSIPRRVRGTADVSRARQVGYYILRHHGGYSFPAIGDEFGRDHSTVIFGVESIEKRLTNDPALQLQIDRVLLLARILPLACSEFAAGRRGIRYYDYLPSQRGASDRCVRPGCLALRQDHDDGAADAEPEIEEVRACA